MSQPIPGLMMILLGIFIYLSIGYKWKPIYNHPRVQFIFKLLGNRGANIFYRVLGTISIIFGVILLFGFIEF
jgi:hypothetical protein